MKANLETVKQYIEDKKSFVWITYIDNPFPEMEIKPTFIDWSDPLRPINKLNVIIDTYPNFTLLETFVNDDLDFMDENYDLPRSYLWDDVNKFYRPFMLFYKNGEMVKHSVGECYCLETLLKNTSMLIPELFEPTSVG